MYQIYFNHIYTQQCCKRMIYDLALKNTMQWTLTLHDSLWLCDDEQNIFLYTYSIGDTARREYLANTTVLFPIGCSVAVNLQGFCNAIFQHKNMITNMHMSLTRMIYH